jgi:heme o synthase
MYLEPAYDAKMSRTRNRPLVRGLLSPRAALLFAIITGAVGTAALYYGVNPTTAALAAGNIVLYAGVYTPLKRIHPINTWVGAVVGAIPPLMGWAAAAGQVASESGSWRELLLGPDAGGGWALAALLFAWQIPHFAGLSFSIRHEYAAAGYKMLASRNPRLDAVLALACALALPVCTAELQATGVVEPWAVAALVPVNTWMVWSSYQFLRMGGAQATARKLFWASVWYLPIVLVVCMVGKKGLGERVWVWVNGEADEDEDEDEDDEEEEESWDEEASSRGQR